MKHFKTVAASLLLAGLALCPALPAAAAEPQSGFYLLRGAEGVTLTSDGEMAAALAEGGSEFVTLYRNAKRLTLTVENAVPEGEYLFRLVRNDTGTEIYLNQQPGSDVFTVAPSPDALDRLAPRQLLTLYITSDRMEGELSLTLGYYNGVSCDCYRPGDTDRNGVVDAADAQNIVDAVARQTRVDVPLYDTDGNGVVTARDAFRILTPYSG